jgi:acyl carrier protein
MTSPNRTDILAAIVEALADVLETDPAPLTEATRADDVEGWDSITHIRLLIALERHFGFEFASDEAAGLANVGALVDLVSTKLG